MDALQEALAREEKLVAEVKELKKENKRLRTLLISAEPKWAARDWLERELKKPQADFDKTWAKS